MDFDPSDADNDHFQKAIDQWQILFDENQSRCNIPPTGPMRGLLDETHITEGHVPFSGIPNNSTRLDSQNIPPPNDDYDLLRSNPTNQTIHRRLRDDSPYGRGGWDPFHPSLERVSRTNIFSKYFFSSHIPHLYSRVCILRLGHPEYLPLGLLGKSHRTPVFHICRYVNNLIECISQVTLKPPNSWTLYSFLLYAAHYSPSQLSILFLFSLPAWRVLTEPAYISKKQWNQLRTILFTNKDENCKYTSVAHDFSVARPIQPLQGRDLYKCRPSDYVSDIEKKRMREETGNPNWCC